MRIIMQGNWLPLAAIIRIFTFSRWHHVGVVLDDQTVIESRIFSGVQLTPLNDFKRRGRWAYIDVELPNEQRAVDWLYAQIGKRYDLTGLVRFAFQRRWLRDDKHYCTDLPAIAAIRGGRPLFNDRVNGYAPRDFDLLPTAHRRSSGVAANQKIG